MLLHDSYEPGLVIKSCFNKNSSLKHVVLITLLFYLLLQFLYKKACLQSWKSFSHSSKTKRSDSEIFKWMLARRSDCTSISMTMNWLCSNFLDAQNLWTLIRMHVHMWIFQQLSKESMRTLINTMIRIWNTIFVSRISFR